MEPFYLCNSAALQAGLTKSAFKVYSFLSMGANNKTHSCFHARATIAKQCGISISTVLRAIKELCDIGLLEVKRRFLAPGKQTTNLYILLDNLQLNIKPTKPHDGTNDVGSQINETTKITASATSEGKLWTFKCYSSAFISKLSANELKIYSYLSYRAGIDGQCMPSKKEIANDCNVSIPTVTRALKRICKTGLIMIIPQTREKTCGNRGTSVNRYVLNSKLSSTSAAENRHSPIMTLLFYFLLVRLTPSPLSPVKPQRTISRMKFTLKQRKKYFLSKLTKWYKANIYPKSPRKDLTIQVCTKSGNSG